MWGGEDPCYLGQQYPRRLSNKHMGSRFQLGSSRLIISLDTLNFNEKGKKFLLSGLVQIWSVSCGWDGFTPVLQFRLKSNTSISREEKKWGKTAILGYRGGCKVTESMCIDISRLIFYDFVTRYCGTWDSSAPGFMCHVASLQHFGSGLAGPALAVPCGIFVYLRLHQVT